MPFSTQSELHSYTQVKTDFYFLYYMKLEGFFQVMHMEDKIILFKQCSRPIIHLLFFTKLVLYCFYFLCSFTSQLTVIPSSHKDIIKIIIVVWKLITTGMIFLPINLILLVFDIHIIAWCPYKYCGYISVIQKTQMLNLNEAHNITNETVFGAVQAVNLTIFDDWQKTVFTTATASGTISYLFMIFVLYSQYSVFGGCICGNIKKC